MNNTQIHFNHFFNNLFIYGTEDGEKLEYCLCSVNNVGQMLDNFVKDAENFLNKDELRQFSDYKIYINFSFFVDCMKSLKLFITGLDLEKIEKEYFADLKGILIPLNCGHILFYSERELETLKYVINHELNEGNEQ